MAHEPGVPLQHYLATHPGSKVMFICRECAAWFSVPLPDVVEDLTRRGVGSASTGIRDVAGFARKPCRKCGGRRFETRPDFPPRERGPP